jgi:RES domain-containing protein
VTRAPAAPILVYRIATEATTYGADDLTGTGSKLSGGRWNPEGLPVVYASTSRALACLETVVHVGARKPLPLNRYLVEIAIPEDAWAARVVFDDPDSAVGWDAEPPGRVSVNWGQTWLQSGRSLVAEVPSVVVPEEANVLLNPAHPEIAAVTARVCRRWLYDARLRR